jgi:hypothetical protein
MATAARGSTGRVACEATVSTVEAAALTTGSAACARGATLFVVFVAFSTVDVAAGAVAATGWVAWVTVLVTEGLDSAGALGAICAGWVDFATVAVTGSAAFDVVPVTVPVTGSTDSAVASTADPTLPSDWPQAEPFSVRTERIAPSTTAGRRTVTADSIMGLKAVYPEALAG